MTTELVASGPQNLVSSRFAPAVRAQMIDAYDSFFGALTAQELHPADRAMITAIGIGELKKALSGDVYTKILKPLCGSPLGFRTDRSGDYSYAESVVVEACCQAIMWGLPLYGDHFQIIGERFYPGKVGMQKLCSDRVQFTVAMKAPKIPVEYQKPGKNDKGSEVWERGCYIECSGTVYYLEHAYADLPEEERLLKRKKLGGQYRCYLNAKNPKAEDLLRGKFERKLLLDLYKILTGQQLPQAPETVGSDEPETTPPVAPTVADALAAESARRRAAAPAPKAAATEAEPQVGEHQDHGQPADEQSPDPAEDPAVAEAAIENQPELARLTPDQVQSFRSLAVDQGVSFDEFEEGLGGPLAEFEIPGVFANDALAAQVLTAFRKMAGKAKPQPAAATVPALSPGRVVVIRRLAETAGVTEEQLDDFCLNRWDAVLRQVPMTAESEILKELDRRGKKKS